MASKQATNSEAPCFECGMCKQTKPAAESFRRQKKCVQCMDAYFANINAQPETECKWCKTVKPREGGFQKNCIVCTACKANPVTKKTQGMVKKSAAEQYDRLCVGLRSNYGADTLGSLTVEQDGECRTSKIVPLKFLTAADVQRLVDTKSNCAPVFSASAYEAKLQILNDELQTMMLPENP